MKGVYDRAALVALSPEMRIRYAAHFADILQTQTQILLISMEYDEARMKGPPFSMVETEIHTLFDPYFSVERIAESSGPDIVGNLKQRGLDTLTEKVYRLIRH